MMNPTANIGWGGGVLPQSTMDNPILGQIMWQTIADAAKKGISLTPKSFFGQRLYDTARVTAGTALTSTPFQLFVNPIGSQQTEINGTTQYTKSPIDTNMTNARQLPAGEVAWITSIQVRCLVVGTLDDSAQTGANLGLANVTGIGNNLATTDDILAANLAQAFYEGIHLQFNYFNTAFENGPLYLFPSRYGVSGVAGGFVTIATNDVVQATNSIAQNEVALNNGFGFVYTLPVVRQIDSLYTFNVALTPYNTFTPSRNVRIQVILEGLGMKSMVG
jgi:hypothetical protein